MIFELFAAATFKGYIFHINPQSVNHFPVGTVSAWVEERHESSKEVVRYNLLSVCGTANVYILSPLRYDGERWVSTGGSGKLSLMREENMHIGVLRQELCHYEK